MIATPTWELLGAASALFWSLTYVLLIYVGFKEKTFGMPLFALGLNISWEFLFSFLRIIPDGGSQRIVNIVWLLLDVAILLTFLKYGKPDFPKLSATGFYANAALVFVVSFGILFVATDFPRVEATQDIRLTASRDMTAMLQNGVMSILFVHLLRQRGSSRGQSIWIAVFKMLGTLCVSLMLLQPAFRVQIYGHHAQIWVILIVAGVVVFAYDMIYTALLYRLMQKENRFPWTKQPGV